MARHFEDERMAVVGKSAEQFECPVVGVLCPVVGVLDGRAGRILALQSQTLDAVTVLFEIGCLQGCSDASCW